MVVRLKISYLVDLNKTFLNVIDILFPLESRKLSKIYSCIQKDIVMHFYTLNF